MAGFDFFRKLVPRVNIARDWERPPDADYQQALHYEGFISPDHWAEDDLSEFPLITRDLGDLDEYLLPLFWDYNQKSRYYQNSFYLYQWIFMMGAFLTTILAVMATYFDGFPDGTLVDFMFTAVNPGEMVRTFSVATMIVSAVTSYFTILSNQGGPRKRWASYRRLAEELRMTYFSFLSRLEPFHGENRLDELRNKILKIRERERESV